MAEFSDDDRRIILEEIIEHLDECTGLIRQLDDHRLNAYCLAEVEGRGGGWLGFFLRDHIEQALQVINEGEPE